MKTNTKKKANTSANIKFRERMLSPWPLSLTFGLTSSIFYIVCAILVKLWQSKTIDLFNTWFHGIDLSKIASLETFGFSSFLIGLVSVLIISLLTGLLFAWIYNACVKHCIRWG